MTEGGAPSPDSSPARPCGARVPLLLLLLAATLCGSLFASNFRGLAASDAFNYAQIARNLARGRGYVTQESMPYEFLRFRGVPHPELLHQPLQAFAISVPFSLFGPQEWMATLPGAIAYILTAPLVFIGACRWAGPFAGVAAALIFLTHPGSAAYATSGLAESLYAFLLTASVLLVVRARNETRWGPMLLIGAMLGLTDLARETGRYLLFASAAMLWGPPRGREARLGGSLLGYLLVTFANYARIASVTGSPFTSYAPSILMCGIPPFEGLEWYRSMSSIDPIAHLTQVPHLLFSKAAFNLAYLAATFDHMVPAVLALTALLAWRLPRHPEARRAATLTAIAVMIQVAVTALFLVDLRHFVPFVPLLAALGGASLAALGSRPRVWPRILALALLGSVLARQIPDWARQFSPPPAPVVERRVAERQLAAWVAGATEPDDVVVSDVSEIIAWGADRRTVWYPLDEALLDRIPRDKRGRQFLCLTSFQIAAEPANPRFGARPPEPWLRYLEGSVAPPHFEVVSELRTSGVTARLFRRKGDSASS